MSVVAVPSASDGGVDAEGGLPLVVHVIFSLAIGGLENGVVNLLNHMPPDRFRHAIVAITSATDFRHRIRRADVPVYELHKQPGLDLGVHVRLYRLLRRLRPTIVHTRNLATLEYQWIAMLAGVPVRVHGEHGWDAADPRGTVWRHLLLRRATRPAVHRYVPMSLDLKRWLTDVIRVRPERVTHLYNGVDTGLFSPAGERRSCDAPGWRDPGIVVLGTVGRLDPIKDQRALLEAVAEVGRADPALGARLRVSIVGDGQLRNALETRAHELGLAERVWFAGAAHDVAVLLRGFDVFVLPSVNEGISNTILEAMATGLPVLATRVGGNGELVVDGTTGALVAAGDVGGLAAAIARYARDETLRVRHGAAGRARVEAEFSLTSMVAGYVRVYDALARARH